MEWVGMLRTWLVGPNLLAVAEEIAAQRRSDVWQRIQHRVGNMALAEARGYVRIKATRLIAGAVQRRVQSDPSLGSDATHHLTQLTMDTVLQQAVVDIMRARQAAATEQPAYRRAA